MSGAWWDETWTNLEGYGCGQIVRRDGYTGDGGVFEDTLYWWQAYAWRGPQWLICSAYQTIKVNGCPQGGHFWENDIMFTEQPMISVTPYGG